MQTVPGRNTVRNLLHHVADHLVLDVIQHADAQQHPRQLKKTRTPNDGKSVRASRSKAPWPKFRMESVHKNHRARPRVLWGAVGGDRGDVHPGQPSISTTHSLVGVPAQVLAVRRLQELFAVVLLLAAPVVRIDGVLRAGQLVARRRRYLLRTLAAC